MKDTKPSNVLSNVLSIEGMVKDTKPSNVLSNVLSIERMVRTLSLVMFYLMSYLLKAW